MGSAGRFAAKVAETIRVVHMGGQVVTIIGGLIVTVFAAGIGRAYGVGWGLSSFLAALSVILFLAGARVQGEVDDLKQQVDVLKKPQATTAVTMSGWTGNTIQHFGQFIGGPLPGGAIPMTPGLLEVERRRQVLTVLVKQYAVDHGDESAQALLRGDEAIPKDWAESRLAELEETWRLESYTLAVPPQELLADYEP